MTRVLRPRGRPGFTLVELLVVVALLIVIAALTVAVMNSGFLSSQKVVGGADRVSGWLLISKQRAKRDGAPRGVRFFLTAPAGAIVVPNSWEVREAQYIEAPDPWACNPDAELNPSGPRLVLYYTQDDQVNAAANRPNYQMVARRVFFVSNNQADLNEFDQRVGVGDYLILPEFGTSYRITGVQNPGNSPPLLSEPRLTTPSLLTPLNAREIGLATFPDLGPAASNAPGTMPVPPASLPPTLVTYQFGFQSAPRPLLGEPTLLLGGDVVIDYRSPVTAPPYPVNGLLPMGGTVGGNVGYRDWGSPASATFPNAPPYWPVTTTGVQTTPPGVIPAGATTAYFDVLFAPSGAVMYNPSPLIALWVRGADKVLHPRLGDPTAAAPSLLDRRAEYDEAGEQVLVIVYTRSGLIATHPLVPPPAGPQPFDPYRNARDGINSGL